MERRNCVAISIGCGFVLKLCLHIGPMIRINRHSIVMEPREERVFRKISIAQKARFPYANLFPTFARIDETTTKNDHAIFYEYVNPFPVISSPFPPRKRMSIFNIFLFTFWP